MQKNIIKWKTVSYKAECADWANFYFLKGIEKKP